MTTGISLKEVDTGANACSVEYCPVPGFEAYVACSTYVLDASRGGDHRHADSNLDTETGSTPPFDVVDDADAVATTSASRASPTCYDDAEGGDAIVGQTRTGTIAIYKTMSVQPQPADGPISESIECQDLTLERAGSVELDGGVLDAKWAEKEVHDHAAALACVTSTGHLCLYMLEHVSPDDCLSAGRKHAELKHLASSAERGCLLLSLDWSGGDIRHAKIVVSQSDGQLAIWRVNPSGDAFVEQVRAWPGHHLRGGVPTEAWISFFRKGDDASLVVSGAEDALLKGWDLRAGDSRGVLPAFIVKDHGAGVTAGHWHPWQEHTFASGSYDEIVRIWDVRSVRCPVSTFPTGGGVWRLKWHPLPDHGDILLAACMHAGVRVLNVSSSSDDPGIAKGVVAQYTRHASMAYGVDWCRLERSLNAPAPVIASCSFYDNLLCLWRTPPLWA